MAKIPTAMNHTIILFKCIHELCTTFPFIYIWIYEWILYHAHNVQTFTRGEIIFNAEIIVISSFPFITLSFLYLFHKSLGEWIGALCLQKKSSVCSNSFLPTTVPFSWAFQRKKLGADFSSRILNKCQWNNKSNVEKFRRKVRLFILAIEKTNKNSNFIAKENIHKIRYGKCSLWRKMRGNVPWWNQATDATV